MPVYDIGTGELSFVWSKCDVCVVCTAWRQDSAWLHGQERPDRTPLRRLHRQRRRKCIHQPKAPFTLPTGNATCRKRQIEPLRTLLRPYYNRFTAPGLCLGLPG